jgi:hypothetical protein
LNSVSPLASGTISNGNLSFSTGNADAIAVGTIGVSSGKWYWEVTATTVSAANACIGIIGQPPASLTVDLRTASNGYGYLNNGNKGNNNSTSAYGATYTSGDVIGVALDLDAGTLVFYKNNSSQGTAYSSLSGTFTPAMSDLASASGGTVFDCNFGQRPLAYTAPSGFKALVTTNLPAPTIEDGGEYFNTVLYTGTGSSLGVTGVGFQPDWVWIKERNGAADHGLYDVLRGVQNQLESNTTTAETAEATGLTAFGSDGFTVGALAQLNTNTDTYVAWNWKANGAGVSNTDGTITSTVSANTDSGFSIVTYTGTGNNATVGHGIGVAPSMVIVKLRSGGANWMIWHKSLNLTDNQFLEFNTNSVQSSGTAVWDVSEFSSSVIGLGSNGDSNGSGSTYVAYCFAPVAGYSAFGSYTGNGSADGPFVYTGFRPRYVLVKNANDVQNWFILDTARSTFNLSQALMRPNTSDAEATGFGIDIISNGFKVRNNDPSYNANGNTIIYAAFAENPFKLALAR